MVDIALATYNGEVNLVQQLDSIVNQEYSDWRLLVRDDVSSDQTPLILDAYAKKFPEKFKTIANSGQNLGSCQNFSEILRHSDAKYVMFSDQDDVWLPDKITKTLAKMKEMECTYGSDVPLLVHTDFKIVDSNLNLLAASGWDYQKIDPIKGASFNRLLVQNVPTGCTTMINKSLCELVLPIPPEARMHDCWVGLVAGMFGHLGFIKEPTLMYRQHGSNVTGAVPWGLPHIIRQLSKLRELKEMIQKSRRQAGAFNQRYHDRLSQENRKMIDIYSGLSEHNCISRKYYIVKYGFYYVGLIRNVGMFILC